MTRRYTVVWHGIFATACMTCFCCGACWECRRSRKLVRPPKQFAGSQMARFFQAGCSMAAVVSSRLSSPPLRNLPAFSFLSPNDRAFLLCRRANVVFNQCHELTPSSDDHDVDLPWYRGGVGGGGGGGGGGSSGLCGVGRARIMVRASSLGHRHFGAASGDLRLHNITLLHTNLCERAREAPTPDAHHAAQLARCRQIGVRYERRKLRPHHRGAVLRQRPVFVDAV